MPLLFWLLVLPIAILALFVALLWHHKKSGTRALNLIGATGFIEGSLDPEGAVIINGELWRARTENGCSLKTRNRVRVIGVRAHLLLIAPMPDEL